MSVGTLQSTLKALDVENLQGINLDKLLGEMLEEIGSTDPELRDKLIYGTFCNLVTTDRLREEQMIELLTTCLGDDCLFLHIEKGESDAVFTRSFSVLVVALILYKDREDAFLSAELYERAANAVLHYLQVEKDVRGYVEEKGWAHSIAHGADALDEVIRHQLYSVKLNDLCLDTIAGCLFKKGVYIDDEDERLLTAVEALLARGLEDYALAAWVMRLSEKLAASFDQEGYSVAFLHTKGNVLNFLKSCYFRLLYNHDSNATMAAIEEVIEIWTKKFYS